jgi:hypothetical protein
VKRILQALQRFTSSSGLGRVLAICWIDRPREWLYQEIGDWLVEKSKMFCLGQSGGRSPSASFEELAPLPPEKPGAGDEP